MDGPKVMTAQWTEQPVGMPLWVIGAVVIAVAATVVLLLGYVLWRRARQRR